MKLDGQPVQFKSTRDSQEAGIVCIYQHSTAYPDLSVTENIFLGHEITKGKMKALQWKEMHAKAQELLDRLGAVSYTHLSRRGSARAAAGRHSREFTGIRGNV